MLIYPNMHKYFFVLGRNYNLSKTEIQTLLNKLNSEPRIILDSKEVLILETVDKLDTENLLKALGGTIKIGEILEDYPTDEFIKNYKTLLIDINLLSRLFDPSLQKLTFGISFYKNDTAENINQIYPPVMKLLPEIKHFLQSSYKASFFKSQERYISSVSVNKNKLLTDGFELIIIASENQVYLGKTLAVQDFEDYSFRDYQRPKRDMNEGIMPPKLAKIMINLSGANIDQNILDPFCGNGTIIQELILLGYKNITGSDLSKDQVLKTIENIDWLFEKYKNLGRSDYNIKIFESDVKILKNKIAENSIDAIITEPFLGSSNLKHFSPERVEEEIRTLEKLYLSAFLEFKKILKSDGKIVIIFPVFKIGGKEHFLNILPQILRLGFSIKDFTKDLQLETTPKGSIIYSRPNQIVNREIFILVL